MNKRTFGDLWNDPKVEQTAGLKCSATADGIVLENKEMGVRCLIPAAQMDKLYASMNMQRREAQSVKQNGQEVRFWGQGY